MRLNLRTISNGLFLIFIGVVFLLINYGFIDWRFFRAFIDFWPVVLIVLGIGLLFNRRVPASLAFLALGIVMVTASFFSPPIDNRPFFNGFPWIQNWQNPGELSKLSIDYPLEKNLTKGLVRINGGGASINITDTEEGFAKGDLTAYGGKPRADFNSKGSEGTLTVDANWSGRAGHGDEYNLQLTRQLPLDLEINTGALSGKFDLTKLKINSLEINSGAADTRLQFGATGMKSRVKISGAASKVTLSIPKEIGVKLKYNGLPLGAIDINNGANFNYQGNTYTTDNFSTAASTLDIEINGAATKVDVVQP